MNWLYIIVMAYIVVSALRGFHKGFIRVVYSMAAILAAVVFVSVTAPYISRMIGQTAISQTLEKNCEKYVRSQINQKLDEGVWIQDIELPWLTLPKKLQKELGQSTGKPVAEFLEKQGIYQKAAKTIAGFCVNLAAFFIALLIIMLILIVIGRKLDLLSKTPGIHLANMIFGFIAGIVKAFLVIWTVFLLIKMTAALPSSASLIRLIEENAVLKNLYDQNRILQLLQSMLRLHL